MKKWAYYNEIDPVAAHVIRNLIREGVVAPGEVDERSIKDVQPEDVAGFIQCHWFAGAALWSVAARLAGWPDDKPLWTGSCPCQPFSVAGKGAGVDDARHLWPDFFRLIRECRPPVVFGEQVSSAAGKRRPVDENVQSMWAGETLLGFLQDAGQARQFEWLARTMQDVLPGMAGDLSDWLEGAEVGFFQKIPGEKQSFGSGCGRALSGERSGADVQPGRIHGRNSSKDRQGAMRADGAPVFAGWREDMGQPVDRPDHPGTWLRHHEHSDRAVFGQCDDEYVGAGANPEGSGWHQGDAGGGCEAPALPVGAKPEEASSLDWLDGVRADLDSINYSLGVTDIPALAVDAPHIRQRLYWVAVADADGRDASAERLQRSGQQRQQPEDGGHPWAAGDGQWPEEPMADADRGGHRGRPEDAQRLAGRRDAAQWADGGVEHATGERRGEGRPEHELRGGRPAAAGADAPVDLGHTERAGLEGHAGDGDRAGRPIEARPAPAADGSFWRDAYWLQCADGKARRAPRQSKRDFCGVADGVARRPDSFGVDGAKDAVDYSLLVQSFKGRIDLWRLVGNSIVPQLAAQVILSFLETIDG